jgi:hypothetical protein
MRAGRARARRSPFKPVGSERTVPGLGDPLDRPPYVVGGRPVHQFAHEARRRAVGQKLEVGRRRGEGNQALRQGFIECPAPQNVEKPLGGAKPSSWLGFLSERGDYLLVQKSPKYRDVRLILRTIHRHLVSEQIEGVSNQDGQVRLLSEAKLARGSRRDVRRRQSPAISFPRHSRSATGTDRGWGILRTCAPMVLASATTASSDREVTSRSRSPDSTCSPRRRAYAPTAHPPMTTNSIPSPASLPNRST